MFLLFINLIRNSLLLSPVILVGLLISKYGYKKYRPDIRYILWLVIGLLLAFPSALSNMLTFLYKGIEPIRVFSTDYSAVAKAFEQAEQMTANASLSNGANASSISSLSYWQLVVILYFIVALIIFIVRFGKYLFYRHKLNRWGMKITDNSLNDLFLELKIELNVKQNITLQKSSVIASPMLIGFFNPTIFLPEKELTPKELRYILTHELIHYKKKDLWSQLFFMMLACLYWANPLVWFMENQAEVDMEIRCDKDALKRFNHADRKGYSYSLLTFVNEKSNKPFENLSTSFGNKNNISKRIETIMINKKQRFGMSVILLLTIIALIMGGCINSGAAENSKDMTVLPEVKELHADNSKDSATANTNLEQPDENLSLEESAMVDLQGFQQRNKDTQDDINKVYADLKFSKDKLDDTLFGWPAPEHYTIESYYGWRFSGSDFHTGIDIADEGIVSNPVVSAADGVIVAVNSTYTDGAGYGKYIVIDHGSEVTSLYAQLSTISVKEGESVIKGQQIGNVGSTGFAIEPHLHFELREKGVSVDPLSYFVETLEAE